MNQETCNRFLELETTIGVSRWSFLADHACVLPCIAQDPGVRLRDIAAVVGVTERTAHRDERRLARTHDGRHVPMPVEGRP